MIIKDIELAKVSAHKRHKEHKELLDKTIKQLDKDKEALIKEFKKKVKKHFKGINVKVMVTKTVFRVYTKKTNVFYHEYGSTTYEDISPSLAKTLVGEYEELYGEVKEKKEVEEISPYPFWY